MPMKNDRQKTLLTFLLTVICVVSVSAQTPARDPDLPRHHQQFHACVVVSVSEDKVTLEARCEVPKSETGKTEILKFPITTDWQEVRGLRVEKGTKFYYEQVGPCRFVYSPRDEVITEGNKLRAGNRDCEP